MVDSYTPTTHTYTHYTPTHAHVYTHAHASFDCAYVFALYIAHTARHALVSVWPSVVNVSLPVVDGTGAATGFTAWRPITCFPLPPPGWTIGSVMAWWSVKAGEERWARAMLANIPYETRTIVMNSGGDRNLVYTWV